MKKRLLTLIAKIFRINLYATVLKMHGYSNYNSFKESGELWFLTKFLPTYYPGINILFDIGANKGEYSKVFRKTFPAANIYCFEPNESLNLTILSVDPKIKVFNIAISNRDSIENFYVETGNIADTHSSLTKRNASAIPISIAVKRLDTVIGELEVVPEVLKVDTEGNDFHVLQGLGDFLNRIKIIQFEINEMILPKRIQVKDFFDLLSNDFDLYRLLPKKLEKITKYSFALEVYHFHNMVAINKSIDRNNG